jgi:hypothetical protein
LGKKRKRSSEGKKEMDETKHHFHEETEQRPSLGGWSVNECARSVALKEGILPQAYIARP